MRRHHFKYVKHLKELLLSTLFLFAVVAGHSVGLASISPSKYTVEGHIVDVKARTIYDGQLVIAGGVIQEIKRLPQALPAHAPYLMPGFIDAHVHIESSMVTPAAYAQEVVRHGTIGAICDAHEIANVLGTAGIDYMIESGRKADFHFMFGAPSCVPCTPLKESVKPGDAVPNQFRARRVEARQLRVAPAGAKLKAMVAHNGQLITGMERVTPKIEGTGSDACVVPDVENDVLKIVVYNRYAPADPQVAFIKGFGLKNAAMASSCAHDSHNIIALGTSDELIAQGMNRIIELQGGQVVVTPERSVELALPIAGLLSTGSMEEIVPKFKQLTAAAREAGCAFDAPFMTLSFMALPVIPALKLSDKGLFDVTKFEFTRLVE